MQAHALVFLCHVFAVRIETVFNLHEVSVLVWGVRQSSERKLRVSFLIGLDIIHNNVDYVSNQEFAQNTYPDNPMLQGMPLIRCFLIF